MVDYNKKKFKRGIRVSKNRYGNYEVIKLDVDKGIPTIMVLKTFKDKNKANKFKREKQNENTDKNRL